MNNIFNKFPWVNYNPNAPALYGQGLSDYEIIVRLCSVIASCVDKVNSFQEIADKLVDYLNEFDKTVAENIRKIIEQWYNDGTLLEMIGSIISGYLTDFTQSYLAKSDHLDFMHSFRTIHYTGNNWSRYTESLGDFDNCQGGCRFTRNNEQYFVEIMHNSTSGRIMIYTNAGGAKTPIKSISIGTTHAQACCYNPSDDCIYVTKFDDSGIYQYNLTTNELTLRQIETTEGNPEPRWWSVKAVKDIGLATYSLYGFKNMGVNSEGYGEVRLYKINFESATATYNDTALLPKLSSSDGYDVFINANCAVNDKYIFILTNRFNAIFVYSRSLSPTLVNKYRKPIWIYNIPNILNEGYATGEIEDLNVDNDLYIDITTLNNLNGDATRDILISTVVRHYVSSMKNGSLIKSVNDYQQTSASTVYYNFSDRVYTIYVDWTSTLGNPCGTTGQPFQTTQEAVEFIKCCPYIDNAQIQLLNNDYLPCFINTSKRITINGVNKKWLCGLFSTSTPIELIHLSVGQSATYDSSYNACINVFNNSQLVINDVQTDKSGTALTGNISTTYDLDIQYGIGIYRALTAYTGEINNRVQIATLSEV